jgi:hypothetical protein
MAGKSSFNLFGFIKKLKLLDWLIIIIFILALLLFYKFVHRQQKWIDIKVLSYSTVFQANSLRIGDYEVDSSGKKIAVVNSFDVVDTPALAQNPFLNKIVVLNMQILVDTNSRSNQIQYKNQPLAVGTQLNFDLNSATIQSYVSEMEGSYNKSEQIKTLTVIVYNQWPWFADAIHVGDYKTDAAGKKTIEVISKDTNPTQVVNTVSVGEVVDYTGSSKVDVTLRLKVLLQKSNGYYIFLGYNNIFVGRPITFTLGNLQITNAAVINIQ